MTTKPEMTLENVKAGDRVICRKELSHPKFIKWKEYDIVIQGESLYIVSHTHDLFSINKRTLEIINEHFTLVTREDTITLSNAAFMYIKGEQYSERIRKIYDEKVTDEINKIWWLNHHYYSLIHGILSPSMHEPNKHILSTSDYLLLLSAPESQAHLLTEKHSNDMAHVSEHLSAIEYLRQPSLKELSQPPVMEGKEDIYKTFRTILARHQNMKVLSPMQISNFCRAMNDLNIEKQFTISSLQSEVEQLKGALQELVDIQNGPPLEQHKNEWQEVMDKCYSILSK